MNKCHLHKKTDTPVIEQNLFIVKDDFPRILNTSFIAGYPQGVERCEYEINLNTFGHLILYDNPVNFKK